MRTLSHPIHLSGIGLHSGDVIHVSLIPSTKGIFFNGIKATPDSIVGSNLCTEIESYAFSISTIEHLMCTLFILGIDSVNIILDGYEMPILDGSAWQFYDALKDNVVEVSESKPPIYLEEFRVQDDDKYISVEPLDHFEVHMHVNFNGLKQKFIYTENTDSEFLKARTFCYLSEVEYMQTHNRALGGSLNNAIVLDDNNNVINKGGFQFEDELAKHKMIDFLGDLYAIQIPLKGKFTCFKTGHQLNNKLVKLLYKEIGFV